MSQDEQFLLQVKRLAGMARMAIEEAESYAEMIEDSTLRAEAERVMEKV